VFFSRDNSPSSLGLLEHEPAPRERSGVLDLRAEERPQEQEELPFSERMPERGGERVPEHYVPHLMLQLQDDLARSRQREAFWMSVATHLVALILVLFAPKILPQRAVRLLTPSQMLQDHQLTYLALPKDQRPPTAPPKTNIISDKNRIAQSRTPELNKRELQRILDAARPGARGRPSPAPGPQPTPPAQAAQAAPQQSAPQQQPSQQPALQRAPASDVAKLQVPAAPAAGAFNVPSPTSQLEMAQRGAALARGGGGAGGDYGSIPRSNAKVGGMTEILSDTMGVDFSNYLERLRWVVRQHWMVVMPVSAMQPPYAKGHVAIQFKITRDGRVEELGQVLSSGDVALDRAALSAIQLSNPLDHLPREFSGPFIVLRCHFFYNPDSSDLQ
jgi:TonB family protein